MMPAQNLFEDNHNSTSTTTRDQNELGHGDDVNAELMTRFELKLTQQP